MHLAALSARYAHHGPVLEHLAADGSPSDEEVGQLEDLLLALPAEARDLGVVATGARRDLLGGEGLGGERLDGVEVQEAVDGSELPGAGLEDLLPDDAADGGAHGRQAGGGLHRKGGHDLR